MKFAHWTAKFAHKTFLLPEIIKIHKFAANQRRIPIKKQADLLHQSDFLKFLFFF
jgi:hypothetical protein